MRETTTLICCLYIYVENCLREAGESQGKLKLKKINTRVYDLDASLKYMLMVFLLGLTKIKSGYQSGSPGWT